MSDKYGKITTEKKEIPADEPLFLFRGQDRFASTAIRFYATLVATVNPAGARDIMKHADEMDEWPTKKIPD